jgi:hypothetical protein
VSGFAAGKERIEVVSRRAIDNRRAPAWDIELLDYHREHSPPLGPGALAIYSAVRLLSDERHVPLIRALLAERGVVYGLHGWELENGVCLSIDGIVAALWRPVFGIDVMAEENGERPGGVPEMIIDACRTIDDAVEWADRVLSLMRPAPIRV